MLLAVLLAGCLFGTSAPAADLREIRERGGLRHLAITYAHFVHETENGIDGLDVEMMRRFAAYQRVAYEMVPATWADVFKDLTGRTVEVRGDDAIFQCVAPVKGDIIANGSTMLPWREKIVRFSVPTFPTGVWLVARADSSLKPIQPSGMTEIDIGKVKALRPGRCILTMNGTCLDLHLYQLDNLGAELRFFPENGSLNDIAPAVIDGVAEATLLDIPDARVALQKRNACLATGK